MSAEPAPPLGATPHQQAAGASVPIESVADSAVVDDVRTRWGDLLTAARAGEREALGQIVAGLTPLVWQVARSHHLDAATSEDVVQTTWLQLLDRLDEIRTPNALVGWLVTVTRREAVRVRDRQRRQADGDMVLDRLADPAALPDEHAVRSERDRTLWSALNHLDERCRMLLRVVAFVERPDYDAVSAALGMPRGSIGPTRGRCLGKLRALLVADPCWSEQ